MPDLESSIQDLIASDELFECQECHWRGPRRSLERIDNPDGSVELACPKCGQAHYIFPPS